MNYDRIIHLDVIYIITKKYTVVSYYFIYSHIVNFLNQNI